MRAQTFDFTAYRVLVVGGTRGTGLTIAHAFADGGAHVTVTGTMMLRELYDADLTPFDYEMVNLARQDSIDHLVSTIGEVDVVVLAAGCNLPYGLPDHERDFIGGAVRSGVLGPMFLATRLRLKLSQSPAPGGGSFVLTGSVRRWLELTMTADEATDELVSATARAADAWTGIGTRINTVIEPSRSSLLPRQSTREAFVEGAARRAQGGDVMVRTQPRVADAMSDAALFLASESAARLTGQSLRLS